MLRLIGSLKLGRVSAMGIMRTLQVDEQPTRLAQAIAEVGRIDKTIPFTFPESGVAACLLFMIPAARL